MDSIKEQLLAMGFTEAKVKRALDSCPDARTLEQVMEWLIAHDAELDAANVSNDEPVIVSSRDDKPIDSKQSDPKGGEVSKDSKAGVEKALKLINERQLKRVDEERRRDIEDEKRRRLDGQKIAQTRSELQDLERIRLAEEIRKEKADKEAHKRKVLEQIARDREAMKARNAASATTAAVAAPQTVPVTQTSSNAAAASSNTAKECRIALRFSDGSSLIQKFLPTDQLNAVKTYVQDVRKVRNGVSFVSPPNRVLNESSMKETLVNLGLCPASRLEVKLESARFDDDVQCLD